MCFALSLLNRDVVLRVNARLESQRSRVRFPTSAVSMQVGFMLKMEVLCALSCAHKISQYLTQVRLSGSPLSPKIPTVALQRNKSSASMYGGGHIETPGTCAFNIHYISISTVTLQRRKSSASMYGGGHIETPGTCDTIYLIYLLHRIG